MKVGLVGCGRLGLPLSLVYAKAGHSVVAVDNDAKRVEAINKREPFFEPRVNQYLTEYGGRVQYATDLQALKDCSLITIIVNTPSLPDGSFDTSAITQIVKAIRAFDANVLISVSSNVNPNTCDTLHKKYGRIAVCPEFIAQGTIIRDFENPKFTVIGAYNKTDANVLRELWGSIHGMPLYVVKPVEAEIVKLGLNVSYCMGITWANVIGELSGKFKADSSKLLNIMHGDWRNYKKGLGYGGFCFPRDTRCFNAVCKSMGAFNGLAFASALESLNAKTKNHYVMEVLRLKKLKVGFLGIGYKQNVIYVEGSQALEIAVDLERLEREIYVYDPLAQVEAKKVLKHAVYCKTVEECIAKVDVVFIGTPDFKGVKTGKIVVNPWG